GREDQGDGFRWKDQMMDVVSVAVVRTSEVRLAVNGEDLIDLVRNVERPFAEADGQPSLAGSYRGLPSGAALPPSEHLLGNPHPDLTSGEKAYVLGCTCGIAGCWPLLVRIQIHRDTVSWSDFEHGFRSPRWRYEGLGPFTFDRAQYESALEA